MTLVSVALLAIAESPVAVPEASAEAMSYYHSGNVLWVIANAWDILIPSVFLFAGLSSRLRDAARRVGRGTWYFTIAAYAIGFNVLIFAVNLPLGYYLDFVREHAYGLSNQTLGKWASDGLLNLAVNLVIAVLFLWVPYLLLRKSPGRWWVYTSALFVPFLFLVVMIAPVWIAPLFNRSAPMKDKALEAKILETARRAGIEGGRVYEIETSVDSKRLNAAVVGFGQTKRIWLTDTLLGAMDERQILFTVGHEMGHYVLGHTWKLVLFLSAFISLTLFAADRIAKGLIARFSARFGFTELHDIASLPLILLVANLLALAGTPVVFAFQRHIEHEADRFGLELTRDNHAAATAFVRLQQENLHNPRPGLLFKLWRSSHPPLGERIDFANSYEPWAHGEPLVYGDKFTNLP